MSRDSFIFYRSFFEATTPLKPEQKAELFDAICEYALNQKELDIEPIPKAMFGLIKPQLDANYKKYLNGKKFGHLGGKYGKEGGRPSGNKPPTNPLLAPKKPSNGNGNGNENVDNENENVDNENVDKLNNTLMSKIEISDVEKYFDFNYREYFEVALAFQELFIKNLKEKNSPAKIQENAKFKNYVTPIRLMIENKEATLKQMRAVFSYLDSARGEFWKSNILSTTKLREKFQQLVIKSNTHEQKKETTIERVNRSVDEYYANSNQ